MIPMLRSVALAGLLLMTVVAGARLAGQAKPQAGEVTFATPVPPPPLFFREPFRQTGAFDASTGFRPQHPVTQAAVTSPNLVLTVYDPAAARIAQLAKDPPPDTNAADWRGPACVLMSGFNQNPPPERVPNGQPTDPPNLWTGACTTPVAVTLKDRTSYVDLTGLAKVRWVTRVSGFHVVRPVV